METRDLYSLNLLAKLMGLHCEILFSLAIAAIAESIVMQISAEHVPSLQRVAPRYLKLVTSSNYCCSCVLFVFILLFSALTSISFAVALSTSLLVRS